MKRWTVRDTQFAAKLYSLAVLACADAGGSEDDIEADVMQRSIDKARADLARMGYDQSEVSSLRKCIEQATSRKPRMFGRP